MLEAVRCKVEGGEAYESDTTSNDHAKSRDTLCRGGTGNEGDGASGGGGCSAETAGCDGWGSNSSWGSGRCRDGGCSGGRRAGSALVDGDGARALLVY
jgi:hypothetical protein